MSDTSFLILANISKQANVKQLIQAAFAYNFQCIIVGMRKIIEGMDLSPYNCIFIDDLEQTRDYLRSLGVLICGLEITDTAISLSKYTFPFPFALMPGNEGSGLNSKQRDISDVFLYIPQFGDGIESLNVTVATTLVMHEFTSRNKSIV